MMPLGSSSVSMFGRLNDLLFSSVLLFERALHYIRPPFAGKAPKRPYCVWSPAAEASDWATARAADHSGEQPPNPENTAGERSTACRRRVKGEAGLEHQAGCAHKAASLRSAAKSGEARSAPEPCGSGDCECRTTRAASSPGHQQHPAFACKAEARRLAFQSSPGPMDSRTDGCS